MLEFLAGLREKLGLAMLFISHDLPAVRHLCDRVVVLYLGRVMEEGPTAELFARPRHPYTRALLSAAPSLDPTRCRKREILAGEPPSPVNPPSGCVCRTRCAYASADCAVAPPPLERVDPAHRAACIKLDAIQGACGEWYATRYSRSAVGLPPG